MYRVQQPEVASGWSDERKNMKSCNQKDSPSQTGTGMRGWKLLLYSANKINDHLRPPFLRGMTRPHVPQERRSQLHDCRSQKSPSRPLPLVTISETQRRNLVPSKAEIGFLAPEVGRTGREKAARQENRVRGTDREVATRQNQIIIEASGFVRHNRNRIHELLSPVMWLALLLNKPYSTAGKKRYLKPLQFTLISLRACVSIPALFSETVYLICFLRVTRSQFSHYTFRV